MGVPEGEERKKEAENLFRERMPENFANLEETYIQVHEIHMYKLKRTNWQL